MGNAQTPAKSQRKSVSLPPMRSSREFILNPARFAVLNPFHPKEKETLKTNIIKNLIYFQRNYCVTSLYTYCLAILTFLVTEYTGGAIALTLTTSLCCTIVYLSGTGRLKISQNGGFEHFMTLVLIVAVLLSVLIRCVSHMYAVFLLLVGILVSICPVMLHASLRVPNIKNNMTVGAEYMGFTTQSFIGAVSTATNKKTLVTSLVTAVAVLHCLFNFYMGFMLILMCALVFLFCVYWSPRQRASICTKKC